ncbi:putative Nudix hydrolase NudL [Pseudoalteromonas sp. P1-9]|uniref:NUDIX hydrolase n=1 Tax=Pseudoalteromonas sp. P1-9 TaxID=1710354 RepID=UPI0006D60A50|nr:CoA pyrophosphatase [Pseudoalteromonas sp. P1-9]KPV94334.1 putative Nudix hydrolase NudL [Pseudoalteromonas sp. P1-9]
MQLSEFLARFHIQQPSNDVGFPIQMRNIAKQSAVLVPLVNVSGEIHLLLCKRPNYLKHHPGQICFPGGKLEDTDANLLATALRETCEEIGVEINNQHVIGDMDSYWTLTGFEIKPYIALLPEKPNLVLATNEVASAFYLPLSQLIDQENWQDIQFTRQFSAYTLTGFQTEYGLLWGATAQIIRNLIKHLN